MHHYEEPQVLSPMKKDPISSSNLLELDNRQRIFEDIIIERTKVIQEFVKTKFGKLTQQIKEMRSGQKVAAALAQDGSLSIDQVELNSSKIDAKASVIADNASIKGTIIEVVEDALKWRLEAHDKKNQEFFDQVTDKIGHYRRAFEVLSSETAQEFASLKAQMVETSGEVLLKVQDSMLPV